MKRLAVLTTLLVLLGAVSQASAAGPLLYKNGEVQNSPSVYLVFWGKNWNQHSGSRTEIREMFNHLSGSAWQGILTQYYDTAGPISAGVSVNSWTDESISAPNAVNNEHAQDEAEYAISQRGWPGAGVNNTYMVLPAPGSKFTYAEGCGVHHYSTRLNAPYAIVGWPEAGGPFEHCSDYDPSGQKRPWVGASMTASHEYAEAVTDPLGVNTGWTDADGVEIADKCYGTYGAQLPNGGWVEALWSNFSGGCSFVGPPAPKWHSDNLGGTFTSDLDIASWGPGRLDVFGRGAENALWHKWWSNATGWSVWEYMGGNLASAPSAVSWGPNRLDVVARATDNTILHWWWDPSGWHSDNLGGNIVSNPDISSWGAGRLDIFGRGPENALWHRAYSNGYFPWESLGGTIAGGPGAVSWAPGRIDIAARTPSNEIAHWFWLEGWHSDSIPGLIYSDPDLSSRGPGRLDLFAQGADGNLYHRWWENATGWSSIWEGLGGPITSGPGAVSWEPNNRIDVVARAADNSALHWYWGP
jgi:hypothetical protein